MTTELTTHTMRQITRSSYGGPSALEMSTVPWPDPEPDRVLVEIKAAAVNPYDVHLMTGTPAIARLTTGLFGPKDPTLGVDFSGVVVAAGSEVDRWKPGDEVFGVLPGTFAEYGLARPDRMARKPAHVRWEEAAAVPLASSTALQSFQKGGGVKPGMNVLINGAAGGIGSQAIQIAKAYGATVTAVCSTRSVELCRELGADHVIDYTKDDYTQTGPYELVLDNVGLRKLRHIARATAEGGTTVMISGPKKTFPILSRMVRMVIGSKFSKRTLAPLLAGYTEEDFEEIRSMLDSGALKPAIHRVVPFEDTAVAMQHQIDGHAQGKTVIAMDEAS